MVTLPPSSHRFQSLLGNAWDNLIWWHQGDATISSCSPMLYENNPTAQWYVDLLVDYDTTGLVGPTDQRHPSLSPSQNGKWNACLENQGSFPNPSHLRTWSRKHVLYVQQWSCQIHASKPNLLEVVHAILLPIAKLKPQISVGPTMAFLSDSYGPIFLWKIILGVLNIVTNIKELSRSSPFSASEMLFHQLWVFGTWEHFGARVFGKICNSHKGKQ